MNKLIITTIAVLGLSACTAQQRQIIDRMITDPVVTRPRR